MSPKYPKIEPKITPPITSVANNMVTPSGVTFSTPSIFTFNRVRNITTPIPSLKSDSPAILVSVTGDKFIFFTIERTAIGSVGAINAPNNRQST